MTAERRRDRIGADFVLVVEAATFLTVQETLRMDTAALCKERER